jgi:DNA polymerase III subunit delta'
MLSDILGQESVVAALKAGLAKDELAQTFLFTGDPHIGKTTAAIEFAKALVCTNRKPGDDDCCDICSGCKNVLNGVHPDVRSVQPVGPSKILRVAQIWPRDGVKDHPANKALLRDLHFAPVSGRRRVFIIESADSMNEDTANSLLKALEEPPPYAIFVLTALAIEAVLPTIYSRSQVFRFRPVHESVILSNILRLGLEKGRAEYLAAFAQGCPGIAITLATASDSQTAWKEITNIAAVSSSGKHPIAAFKMADDFRKTSAKLPDPTGANEETGARTLLAAACEILLFWYRDLLIRRSTSGTGRILHADRLDEIDAMSLRYSIDHLKRAVHLVQDAKRYIERNANAQVTTEYLMLNLLALGRNEERRM